ncbi:VTT domain-containing protein [Roseomonas sp. NAR14]|uniref:VTT domain-containing protein n=1 Tax=Roseomonas acroporae TaxID=2937791 RepID=A0A9X1Y6W8_9PROT|nr:VTT domain-containing protein [Roseomonas acroporae]MCK8784683.1 VTT domain-containing protein [Roseomonas acroporae]
MPPRILALGRRFWPLALLLAALALAVALGANRWLAPGTLSSRGAELLAAAAAEPMRAALLYVAAYIGVVSLSLPAPLVMPLTGGLLFGPWLGTALAVPAATAGACLVFLAVRHGFGDLLERHGGARLRQVDAMLRREGGWYLLVLRLLPLVPFWVINLAAPLSGLRLGAFALATLVGIVPGTLVYASLGAGLAPVLMAGGRVEIGALLTVRTLLPLFGLAVLAGLGAWWRSRRGATEDFAPHGPGQGGSADPMAAGDLPPGGESSLDPPLRN